MFEFTKGNERYMLRMLVDSGRLKHIIMNINGEIEIQVDNNNISNIINSEYIDWDATAKLVNAHKPLNVTSTKDAKDKISDIKVWGDPDMFKLLCKASSDIGNWSKSTKAMEIGSVGCIVQTSTNIKGLIAESLVFVPNTIIKETKNTDGVVISRKLVPSNI